MHSHKNIVNYYPIKGRRYRGESTLGYLTGLAMASNQSLDTTSNTVGGLFHHLKFRQEQWREAIKETANEYSSEIVREGISSILLLAKTEFLSEELLLSSQDQIQEAHSLAHYHIVDYIENLLKNENFDSKYWADVASIFHDLLREHCDSFHDNDVSIRSLCLTPLAFFSEVILSEAVFVNKYGELLESLSKTFQALPVPASWLSS